jgi:hypothetical protein
MLYDVDDTYGIQPWLRRWYRAPHPQQSDLELTRISRVGDPEDESWFLPHGNLFRGRGWVDRVERHCCCARL